MTTHTLKEHCPSRGYTYRAIITRKTGALLAVRSGCRHWRNFEKAFAHYNPHGKRFLDWPRWSDGWILSSPNDDTIARTLQNRFDSRQTLLRLQKRVEAKRRQIRRERRKAHK